MGLKRVNQTFKLCFWVLILFGTVNSCTTSYRVNSVKDSYLRIDPKLDSGSNTIDSIINPYKTGLDKIMNEEIGYSDGLTISKPESTLGNWVADALKKNAEQETNMNIAFAVQNYGGIRIKEIPKGPVTLSKIYELMPFDNYLAIMEVDGKIVAEFLDRLAKYGRWPVSSSLKFRIEGETAKDIFIDGVAFVHSLIIYNCYAGLCRKRWG